MAQSLKCLYSYFSVDLPVEGEKPGDGRYDSCVGVMQYINLLDNETHARELKTVVHLVSFFVNIHVQSR